VISLLSNFPALGLAYRFPILYRMLPDADCFPYAFTLADLDRMIAIERLPAGALVLDIACGEGQMALHLARQRSDIHVLGIDRSVEMLEGAKRAVAERQLKNCAFELQDSASLSQEMIERYCVEHGFPPQAPSLIVVILGFSAMPDYAEMIDHLTGLLPEGGVFVTLDVWRERSFLNHINVFIYQLLLSSNCYRPIRQRLAQRLAEFEMIEKVMRDDITHIGIIRPFICCGIRRF
jgi:ubiquinone/menaquinone biosynthesis C-methylase UbiE